MMSPKWINNVRLPWRDGLWQIAIADGKIARLSAQPQHASPADESLDGEGGLACAPFIEPHIHLDTTQTAGEPAWNQSGTLFEGIERSAMKMLSGGRCRR
jgi:cytosine deaminase